MPNEASASLIAAGQAQGKSVDSFDRKLSLQQLDGDDWGEPAWDSHLVTECHRLRRVPLSDFTTEDLRILIGQNFSLEYLIPIALERLADDPLASGMCYSGDLLMNVLRCELKFWLMRPDLKSQVTLLVERALSLLAVTNEDGSPRYSDIETHEVKKAHDVFRIKNHQNNLNAGLQTP